MSSAATAASGAMWTEMKLSGRKIKERFYTQVEAPADAEEDLPHFRCRCGKVRIQSLKHGYTNLKQHVMLKHPDWLLECADEMQMTPPISPKPIGSAVANGSATKTAKLSKTAATVTPVKGNDDVLSSATLSMASPLVAGASVASELAGVVRRKRKMSVVAAETVASEQREEEAQQQQPAASTTRRKRSSSAGTAGAATVSATTTSAAASASSSTVVAASAAKKRADYISWDDYFMSVAFLSAMRSKDPSTQVGACIVNDERKIVGIGYNGFPNGCSDDTLPWARETKSGDPLDTKYPFVCHAEMNAILNKNASELRGCTIYVALFPCNECAKLIIQCGIKHIVYLSDKYHDDWKMVASRRMLDMAGVEYRQHHVDKSKIVIDFSAIA